MTFKYCPLAIAVLLLVSCSKAPVSEEQQFLEDVAAAMGGGDAIAAVDTLTMEAEGRMLNLGQDLTPESATMEFDISDYQLAADLANGSSRTTLTRTPLFDYFRGRDPMTQTSGIDGSVAYDVAADGTSQRAPDSVAAERRSTYYHHPLPLLRAALVKSAVTSNIRSEAGRTIADITTADDKTFALAVDPDTHLPVFIRSKDHHGYLRDVMRQTGFSDYALVDGLNLPSQITQSLDEFHLFALQVLSQELNAPIGNLAAPPEVANAPRVSGANAANVAVEQLDDGIWYLNGQSHHSVLFEFNDHLMLLEAPNEIRTQAVLATARDLVPGKPVTHLINTHHHFDHSGGVRTAISEGLTIVTQAANEAFYRRMAGHPSTLSPDTLSQAPGSVSIEVVAEQATYADDSLTVELYHIVDSGHSSSILMAYLPEQRLLIQADVFNPGRTTPQLFAPNLLDNIQRYGLEVDRIVPIHGGIVDFEVLENAVQELRN